ncbi:MAG: peptidoglycan-binding protein [Clostridia bacterium]|nr:peptidoglycan-binding protein [Clostridia bacterium]
MPYVIDHTDASENIRELQTMLRTLSFHDPSIPSVAVTGIRGEQTDRAVRAFREQQNLPPSSDVDAALWEALRLAYQRTLALYAAAGALIPLPVGILAQTPDALPYFTPLLQTVLSALAASAPASPPVAVTGVYDEATAAAVAVIQALCGLPATGRLDIPTWNAIAALFNHEMRKLSSSPPIRKPDESAHAGILPKTDAEIR